MLGLIGTATALADNGGRAVPFKKRLAIWWHDGAAISKSLFPYVLFGVGLAAFAAPARAGNGTHFFSAGTSAGR